MKYYSNNIKNKLTALYNRSFNSNHEGNLTVELLKLEDNQLKRLTCQKSIWPSESKTADRWGD